MEDFTNDPILKDIPAIADHALALLDRLQRKSYFDPSKVDALSKRCIMIERYGIRPPRGYDLLPQSDFERWIVAQEKTIETKKLKRVSEFDILSDDEWAGLRW